MYFHPLDTQLPAPRRMNDPFHYTPGPLCLLAAEVVQRQLPAHPAEGKMVGVLLVEHEGQLGYLQALSGQTDWALPMDEFVPPVFDYLRPEGYFKRREEEIVQVSHRLATLLANPRYQHLLQERTRLEHDYETTLADLRARANVAKALRDQRRKEAHISEQEREAMVRESQFHKGQIRRLEGAPPRDATTAGGRPTLFRSGAGPPECEPQTDERRTASMALRTV